MDVNTVVIKESEAATDTISQDSNVSMPLANLEENNTVEVKVVQDGQVAEVVPVVPVVADVKDEPKGGGNKKKNRQRKKIVKQAAVVPSEQPVVHSSAGNTEPVEKVDMVNEPTHAFMYGEHELNVIWIGENPDKKLKNTGWYRAKDCTHIFGFKNILEMITKNVSAPNFMKAKTLYKKMEAGEKYKMGDRESTLYIRDEGLYELIAKSNMENPKEFKSWIKANGDQLKALFLKKKVRVKKQVTAASEAPAPDQEVMAPVLAPAPAPEPVPVPVQAKLNTTGLEHEKIVNERLQIVSNLIKMVLEPNYFESKKLENNTNLTSF